MKQGIIFADTSPTSCKNKKAELFLFVDGASRGNPGPAGAGICILKNGEEIFCEGYFLGSMTNNEAEYTALLLGLAHVETFISKDECLEIRSDSQLLVRQILGIYKVKKTNLQILHSQAMKLLSNICYCVRHVPREKNKRADQLANKGLDSRNAVPEHLRNLMC